MHCSPEIIFAVAVAAIGGAALFLSKGVLWTKRRRGEYVEFHRRQAEQANARCEIADEKEAERIKRGKISWSKFFYGGLLLIWGLFIVYWLGTEIYNLARTRNWQPTDCVVLSIRSEQTKGNKMMLFYPVIAYSYEAADETLTGDRFEVVDSFFNREEIKEVLQRYQPGTRFECFYNPQNRNESFADQTMFRYRLIGYLIMLLTSLVLAAFLLREALPRRREGKI